MAMYRGQKIPTCYATCSIGHKDSHTLPTKLEAIANAGFEAIELSMPDILSYGAQVKNTEEIDAKDYDVLEEVGYEIKKLIDKYGLKVLMLQPFANFEGWPRGSKERQDAFDRARGWMRVMKAIGTDMLQIGSSDAPAISSNVDDLANDLAELADEMASHGLRIAYENWCWATHAPNWHDVWTIVDKANRSNIGLCLDTFQSAGGEWADPTTSSGLLQQPTAISSLPQSQPTTTSTSSTKNSSSHEGGGADENDGTKIITKAWKSSCAKLSTTIPPEKIFLLQISDAYHMNPPLENSNDSNGLRPRGQWSHDFRPLPYDGGYLPIADFTAAVMSTGFRGWLSMEVFDGKAPEKYGDIMIPYAQGAMTSLQRLLDDAAAAAAPAGVDT